MTSSVRRGLAVALVHVFLVSAVAGKFLWDRSRLPRVWAQAHAYDPDSPLRGRYVRITVDVEPTSSVAPVQPPTLYEFIKGRLRVDDGRLVADIARTGQRGDPRLISLRVGRDEKGDPTVRLYDPLAFFIPEHVADPTVGAPGEQLWVEVTVPRRGLPRPIRLGRQRHGGEIEPIRLTRANP